MITDVETNHVYLSSVLKTKYPKFWNELETILKRRNISYNLIENTRDIWCRDYMPIQIEKKEFVQFQYFPDYYLTHNYIKLLTIQDEMKYDLIGNVQHVDLIVDCGNIVRTKNKAVMTEKVISANKNKDEKVVKSLLKKTLKVDELIFIPAQPYDLTGHSDGMVRFYNEKTILVNEFYESDSWMKKFNNALNKTGLTVRPFPYVVSDIRNDGEYTAHGCYINFAQIGSTILFPQFGGDYADSDKTALKCIKDLYKEPEFMVEPINASNIAFDGGVLNCCTWNICK